MERDTLLYAEATRLATISATKETDRQKYSQYLTPKETALFAASMFNDCAKNSIDCLDLGGGTGILTTALYERYGSRIRADIIEIDPEMTRICDDELTTYGIAHRVFQGDVLAFDFEPSYERVILNPPYRKMAADDPRQAFLPVKGANLYSAFLMRAIQALRPFGECVAIVPRSWTNGEYFAPFRRWLYDNASIDWIHVYGSRTEVFSDTNVLQETMLVKFSKRSQCETIKVTESFGKFDDITIAEYPASQIISGPDEDRIVRIKPVNSCNFMNMASLKEQGLLASTGKIVDFRSRDKLFLDAGEDRVPLIYACNFSSSGFSHPVLAGKMQWYQCRDESDMALLVGPGAFVVVKRFSSKEENKRVKAFALFADEPVALENHLNFIHAGKPRCVVPLCVDDAKGLTVWLNSSFVDDWFRSASGSTQVNASDLNRMPVPCSSLLQCLADFWRPDLSQYEIDSICEDVVYA